MTLWTTAAGVAVSAAAIVTTVILWRIDAHRRNLDARAVRRQALISRVLELAERTNRNARFGSLAKLWFTPALEWAFLLPRIYYELQPKERAVARWIAGQNRLIQTAVRSKDVARIAAETAYTLAEWERGARATAWFATQVGDTDPLQGPWTLSRGQRLRSMARDSRAFLGWWALASGLYFAGMRLKRELDAIP